MGILQGIFLLNNPFPIASIQTLLKQFFRGYQRISQEYPVVTEYIKKEGNKKTHEPILGSQVILKKR